MLEPSFMKFPSFLLLAAILAACILAGPGCSGKAGNSRSAGEENRIKNKNFKGTWWNHYERALLRADEKSYRQAEADLRKALEENNTDQWQAVVRDGKNIDYFPHRELGIIHYRRREYGMAIAELAKSIENAPSAKASWFLNRARAAEITRDESDMYAPELVLETSSAGEITGAFTKTVKGVAWDDTYVAEIQVNNMPVPLELAKKKSVFSVEVPLGEGENTILVRATDLAGKTTAKQMRIFCDRQGPLVEIMATETRGNEVTIRGSVSDTGGIALLKINGRKWAITGASYGYNFTFTQPPGPLTIYARDRAGNVTRATLQENDLRPGSGTPEENPADTVAPFITLGEQAGARETFQDRVLFNVRISDSAGIHSIFVNTEPVLLRKGKIVFFSLRKKLAEGDNAFQFIAFDRYGNKADKKVAIVRKRQKIDRIDSRMRVLLQPFANRGSSKAWGPDTTDRLFACFADLRRFQLVKGKTTVAPARNGPPVDAVLSGRVSSSADLIEIAARLADADTSEILAGHDVFGRAASPEELDGLLTSLARKFADDFPVARGMITEVRGSEVTVDLGTAQGIKPHTWFLFYRDAPPVRHPVTGALTEPDPDILGMLQVQEVSADSSMARFPGGNTAPRKYDGVIVR